MVTPRGCALLHTTFTWSLKSSQLCSWPPSRLTDAPQGSERGLACWAEGRQPVELPWAVPRSSLWTLLLLGDPGHNPRQGMASGGQVRAWDSQGAQPPVPSLLWSLTLGRNPEATSLKGSRESPG